MTQQLYPSKAGGIEEVREDTRIPPGVSMNAAKMMDPTGVEVRTGVEVPPRSEGQKYNPWERHQTDMRRMMSKGGAMFLPVGTRKVENVLSGF